MGPDYPEDEMDLKGMANRAKELVDKRGGTDALKEDAAELKDIAAGKGSLADKAKAAAEVIKTPGGEDAPAAETASEPERERAGEKTGGEERGKHADRGGRGQGAGKRRGGRNGGDGRGRDRV